jgi:hypothetical protein
MPVAFVVFFQTTSSASQKKGKLENHVEIVSAQYTAAALL